jgi:glycosyltransferase involved in cell wall biosynthesis
MAHPLIDNSLISGKGFKLSDVSSVGRIARLMIEDLNRADKIIVISDFIKKTCILAGIDGNKIEVAYLPPAHELVEISRNLSLNQSKTSKRKLVIFVGTLSYRKGIDILLSVAKLADKMGLNIQFTAIGSWSGVTAEFRNEFLNMPNINVLPWLSREDLVAYYRNADFLFCPTRADGGARVITEAMLFGVVVVTTNVSGSPINPGHDGFEFEIDDQREFMAKTLEVFAEEEIAKEVGNNARLSVVTNLTFENYLTKILSACS